jgi:hypothetical protein
MRTSGWWRSDQRTEAVEGEGLNVVGSVVLVDRS